MRMGVPVSPRNIFPSNIQGLPTWYEVRVSESGLARPARRRGPDGRDEPADLGQGPRRDRAGRLPLLRLDQAAAGRQVPRRHQRDRHAAHRDLQRDLHRPAPAPAVQEHHLRGRARRAPRHGHRRGREADRRAVQGQGEAPRAEPEGAAPGARLRARAPAVPARPHGEARRQGGRQGSSSRATTPTALGAVYGGRHGLRVVPDHAVVVGRGGLRQALPQAAARTRPPARTTSPSCRPRTSSPPSAW